MNRPFKYCATMLHCKAGSDINCGDLVRFSEKKWIQRLKDQFGIAKKVRAVPNRQRLKQMMLHMIQQYRHKQISEDKKMSKLTHPKNKLKMIWIEETTEIIPKDMEGIIDNFDPEICKVHTFEKWGNINKLAKVK